MDDAELAREIASRTTDELRALAQRLFAGQRIGMASPPVDEVDPAMTEFVKAIFPAHPDTKESQC